MSPLQKMSLHYILKIPGGDRSPCPCLWIRAWSLRLDARIITTSNNYSNNTIIITNTTITATITTTTTPTAFTVKLGYSELGYNEYSVIAK